MGKGYLIDTNVVIDYLENKLPEHSLTLIDGLNVQMSIISRMEILAWPSANEDQITILTEFINASSILSLSEDIILKTIDIRKNYRIKLPDAIIAATAMINGFSLFTRNMTDFKKVNGLVIIDPYSLK